jgi:epidermal growth factor receptor substrate 15
MLEEIEKLKRIDASYKEKVEAAEVFAKEKNYDRAISKYEEAASLKKDETLPGQRIAELKKAQSEFLGAAQKESLFNENYKKGTAAKAAKTYELALENFNKALSYKPDDQATKDHINEIKQIIEERKLADADSKNQREKMAALVKAADDLFNLGDWGEAKKAYEVIIEIDKNKAHANARIKECDLRLSEEKNKLANSEYKALIASADNNFEKRDFLRSKELFEKARTLRPKESYPIQKLAEIDLLLHPLIIESSTLEALGDVYTGANGEADLVQADLDRKNEKNNKFADAINVSNAQREKYSYKEEYQNYETKDAIGNIQIRGEQESQLAKEQVQRKQEYLTQIQKYGNDLNEQNALYEQSDNYQSQEKIKYIERNVAQTAEIQGQAYKLNAQKVKDNASRINAMNESRSLAHQDYQIQNGTELTKMSIEAQESLNDDASRLAMQKSLEEKKTNTADLALNLKNDEFKSTRQTTEGLNALREKSEQKSILEGERLASNNEQIKSVESKMQDEGRKAYNHEMEIYLQTKESISTQEKVGIRKANEADDKIDANNRNIKAKRIDAEKTSANLGDSERIDNQNSQASLNDMQAKGNQISTDYVDKQYDNSQTLKVKKDAALALNERLDQKADNKNLESRGNIEILISESAARDKQTIDKQLKNAKMVDEIQSVASTQAEDNAKRAQENQREITNSLNKVDSDLDIAKPRNTLGDEYSEGVTEEKFSQNGPDGKLSKILTRRIVVVDGHGDVYVRTQMKGVTTYKKNNEAISEYTWQKETQNSSLVRH